MRTIRMLGRLLWKESREGWIVVAIACLLPPCAFALARHFRAGPGGGVAYRPELEAIVQFVATVCSLGAIMLWGVLKGERLRNQEKLPLAHVPASVVLERAVLLGLPLIISVLAGAWFGRCCAAYGAYNALKQDTAAAAGMFAAYGAFAFAACCLLSASVSSWAAVVLGIPWTLFGVVMAMGIHNVQSDLGFTRYLARITICAVGCLLLFLILSYKRRCRFAWAPPLIILILAVLWPLTTRLVDIAHAAAPYSGNDVTSSDGAIQAGQVSFSHNKSVLTYLNRVSGRVATVSFDGITTPVAADNSGLVYLVQYTKGRNLRAIAWDGKTLRRIANIPGDKHLLDRAASPWPEFNSVSPDRRYVLFSLRSAISGGADVWIVDASYRKAWIVAPNQWFSVAKASWMGNRVGLSGNFPRIQIADLRTRKLAIMQVPGREGG